MSEKHENPGSHIQPASSPVARRISLAPTATKSSTAALWDSSPRVPSSRDADEALEFLENHPRAAELLEEARTILADPVRSRKLTRKIDWVVLPSLIVTYFLQYLDKMTLPVGAPDPFLTLGLLQYRDLGGADLYGDACSTRL